MGEKFVMTNESLYAKMSNLKKKIEDCLPKIDQKDNLKVQKTIF